MKFHVEQKTNDVLVDFERNGVLMRARLRPRKVEHALGSYAQNVRAILQLFQDACDKARELPLLDDAVDVKVE